MIGIWNKFIINSPLNTLKHLWWFLYIAFWMFTVNTNPPNFHITKTMFSMVQSLPLYIVTASQWARQAWFSLGWSLVGLWFLCVCFCWLQCADMWVCGCQCLSSFTFCFFFPLSNWQCLSEYIDLMCGLYRDEWKWNVFLGELTILCCKI